MRCLMTADLHYSLKHFDWLLSEAADFDMVILAGDLLELSSSVPFDAQITVVRKYLDRLKSLTRLVVCSGNHDLEVTDDSGERAAAWVRDLAHDGIATDGTSLTVDGTLITVCPWWDGPDSRARIAAQLEADAAKPRDHWIWVYHAPPADSPVSWSGTRHFGDTALSDWIGQYRPDLVLSGHVHESPFARGGSWADRIGETWIFNPGKQIGDFPTHVIFDLEDAAAAAWFSFSGGEELALDQPLVRPIPALTALPAWMK